jgi:hypothetical protein
MPIFVILSCESFDMIVAGLDRAFLGAFVLVGEHMSFQVFENLAAFWVCAASLLPRLLAAEVVLTAV